MEQVKKMQNQEYLAAPQRICMMGRFALFATMSHGTASLFPVVIVPPAMTVLKGAHSQIFLYSFHQVTI